LRFKVWFRIDACVTVANGHTLEKGVLRGIITGLSKIKQNIKRKPINGKGIDHIPL
jgi:hypothetical protein